MRLAGFTILIVCTLGIVLSSLMVQPNQNDPQIKAKLRKYQVRFFVMWDAGFVLAVLLSFM